MSAALQFADRAYVLDRGRVALEGAIADLRADPGFRSGYVTGNAFARVEEETEDHDSLR